jgi:hypothetical protein
MRAIVPLFVGLAISALSGSASANPENYTYTGMTCRTSPWATNNHMMYVNTGPARVTTAPTSDPRVACPIRVKVVPGSYGISSVRLFGFHNSQPNPLTCTLVIRDGNGLGISYQESRSSPATPGIFWVDWDNIPSNGGLTGGIWCWLNGAPEESSDDIDQIRSYRVTVQ